MTIQSDRWIRRMAQEHGMIEPFEPGQVRDGTISYGVSSYGYDIRVAPDFKVFTNVHNVVVDPKEFDDRSFVDVEAEECLIPPNSFALARTVEYFRIPRDVLVLCVGKSTYARCFRGDTRVALVDGTAPTLEDMARRAEDGEMFWGYSLDRYGRIIVTLLDAPRYVGRDALVELTLDNGRKVRCTPDHEFPRRDGTVAAAHDLRVGDSLMPLYRDVARGYEMVYQPLNGHLFPTHRLADEWNLRNGLYEDLPDEHSEAIRAAFARLSQDPEWRGHLSRVQSDRALRFWNEERYAEAREQLRRRQLAAWEDEHRREAASTRLSDFYRNAANRKWQAEKSRRFPDVLAEVRGRGGRNHKIEEIRELPGDHDVYCLTVPEAGNFALESGVFTENCGIIVNVTPLEPTWEGHLTLEISNTTPLPAKIYANEGIAQLIFFQGKEAPEVAYADRKGKYQGQQGVTLPKL